MKKTKEIKKQWTSFVRIELGNFVCILCLLYIIHVTGLEVFYQVAGQITLLLFANTLTSTTGGLEAVFTKQKSFFGIKINPFVVLAISIAITLKSCITLNLKTVQTEKQFVPFTSTLFILLWGLFSSLRRIISMVCFFVPSLGLFNILYQ